MASSPQLKTRPRRTSRFTEGSESTLEDSSNTSAYTQPLTLQTILFEMDEHERRRTRGSSNSSVESFSSSNAVSSPKEGLRRSEDVGRSVSNSGNGRRSVDGHAREGEGLASKVKGRLRAFTGERRRDVKGFPYPGT